MAIKWPSIAIFVRRPVGHIWLHSFPTIFGHHSFGRPHPCCNASGKSKEPRNQRTKDSNITTWKTHKSQMQTCKHFRDIRARVSGPPRRPSVPNIWIFYLFDLPQNTTMCIHRQRPRRSHQLGHGVEHNSSRDARLCKKGA